MTRIASTYLQSHFAQTMDQVAKKKSRIAIHRRGRTVAALVPAEDLVLLKRLQREAEDRADLRAFRRAKKERGSIPWSEVEKRLDRLKD